MDARRPNAHCHAPPSVQLLSSEGLARLAVGNARDMDSELHVGWNRGRASIHNGEVDVRGEFNQIKPCLGRLFCFPPVSAGTFIVVEIEGQSVKREH